MLPLPWAAACANSRSSRRIASIIDKPASGMPSTSRRRVLAFDVDHSCSQCLSGPRNVDVIFTYSVPTLPESRHQTAYRATPAAISLGDTPARRLASHALSACCLEFPPARLG